MMNIDTTLATPGGITLPPGQSQTGPAAADADPLDFALLNDFQRGFPLVAEPWAAIAARLGCGAGDVLARLERLRDGGKISRVGPVFAPNRIGASTLAAMAVPVGDLPRVVAIVNAFAGVNHNYRREHRYNLWFVASSTDEAALARLLADMGAATGCPPIALPLLEEFHIDLGFDLASGRRTRHVVDPAAPRPRLSAADWRLIDALHDGLPWLARPYQAVAEAAGLTETSVLDTLAAWQADPSLAVNATEEIIRWTSPVRSFFRWAQQDHELGGVTIPAGDIDEREDLVGRDFRMPVIASSAADMSSGAKTSPATVLWLGPMSMVRAGSICCVNDALTMSVNVSPRQFRHPMFVDEVLALVESTGIDPRRLKLELTENLLLGDLAETVQRMGQLKARGIGFALDDFGIGYSSLRYLKALPLDQLKVDRSFVNDVPGDPNGAAIVQAILTLAQSLQMEALAEGVESAAQVEFLTSHGCTRFQGFHFGHPMPIEDFEGSPLFRAAAAAVH